MPIFISYNHNDKNFVDILAKNLQKNRHHIWLDTWELNAGDSLIDKVQNVLTRSSAILVILSKDSIESAWCKKELNAGLMRELDEKKTILIPCLIDDCTIPLFLREKLYVDFRKDKDRDEAFNLLNRSLAKISNWQQSRIDNNDDSLTDWSIDWDILNDNKLILNWTFVEHGHDWPYITLTKCSVDCDSIALQKFKELENADRIHKYMNNILSLIISSFGKDGLTMRISDTSEKKISKRLKGKDGELFDITLSCRRMGEDNGLDTLLYLDKTLALVLEHQKSVTWHYKDGDNGT